MKYPSTHLQRRATSSNNGTLIHFLLLQIIVFSPMLALQRFYFQNTFCLNYKVSFRGMTFHITIALEFPLSMWLLDFLMWLFSIYDHVTLHIPHMTLVLPHITFCPFPFNNYIITFHMISHHSWTHLTFAMKLVQITTWQWWHGLHDEMEMPRCSPFCVSLTSLW